MTRPRLAAPPGACDSHIHVFAPARYPYAAERGYTPDPAPIAAYREVMARLGLARAVIVQPSVYGCDNRATLAAVREGGDGFRAVAVLGDEHGERELEEFHQAGVRGVRVNDLFAGDGPPPDLESLAARIVPFGWHLQILTNLCAPKADMGRLAALPVEVVIDHMGHAPAAQALAAPAFANLLALMRDGRAWVKLSGAYRIAPYGGPDFAEVRPLAEALVEAAPERLVWGSDWPHPALEGPLPETAALLDLLLDWIPDAPLRRRVLVDNPARLYGFV